MVEWRHGHHCIQGFPVHTTGDLPCRGLGCSGRRAGRHRPRSRRAPRGRRVVLNIFPSVDTGVCATSVRKFNELAAGLDNTSVICVSKDLPFALGRFCGAEGIENVTAASAFRSDFGTDYGVTMTDGPLAGLLARSVVVLDETGTVIHSQLVPEITTEPDYDAAVAALG